MNDLQLLGTVAGLIYSSIEFVCLFVFVIVSVIIDFPSLRWMIGNFLNKQFMKTHDEKEEQASGSCVITGN